MTDPGNRTPLNDSYWLAWRVLHLVGVPAVLLWHPLAPWYTLTVAVVEVLAWRTSHRATLSENIWSWLYDMDDDMITWRVVLTALWTLWFGLQWYLWGWPWIPESVRAWMMIAWLLVIWAHFLHDHRSKRRPHG